MGKLGNYLSKELLIHSVNNDLGKLPTLVSINFPSLKVAGLNPHAGEEGILGHEEKKLINNAIISWSKKNKTIKVIGPVPPDTCWISAANAWNSNSTENDAPDGILALYHDQGLIPVKLIAFESHGTSAQE